MQHNSHNLRNLTSTKQLLSIFIHVRVHSMGTSHVPSHPLHHKTTCILATLNRNTFEEWCHPKFNWNLGDYLGLIYNDPAYEPATTWLCADPRRDKQGQVGKAQSNKLLLVISWFLALFSCARLIFSIRITFLGLSNVASIPASSDRDAPDSSDWDCIGTCKLKIQAINTIQITWLLKLFHPLGEA